MVDSRLWPYGFSHQAPPQWQAMIWCSPSSAGENYDSGVWRGCLNCSIRLTLKLTFYQYFFSHSLISVKFVTLESLARSRHAALISSGDGFKRFYVYLVEWGHATHSERASSQCSQRDLELLRGQNIKLLTCSCLRESYEWQYSSRSLMIITLSL